MMLKHRILFGGRYSISNLAGLKIIVGCAAMLSTSQVGAQNIGRVPEQVAAVVSTDPSVLQDPKFLEKLRVGDTLKIVVYEALSSDEDKWSAPPGQEDAAPRGFYQRPELTAEYLINEDGTISMPLLGRFEVSGLLPKAAETSIVRSYESLVGKKGFVTILSVEHEPVYIAGNVKNPGTLKFLEGMTVLHAVAAAGGIPSTTIEPWQRVEVVRQIERLKSGLDDLRRLAARTEVLRAACHGTSVSGPNGMSEDHLNADARLLLSDEQRQRQLVTLSRDAEKDALVKSVENAQADLDLREKRVGTYDNTLTGRQKRLKTITNLARNKLVSTNELTRAQSEFSDASDRKQQAVIDVENARQQLSVAKQNLDRQHTESTIEIEKSVSDAKRGLSQALQTTDGDLQIFQAMVSTNDTSASERVKFEIVHREGSRVVVEPATEETILQPGDLVHVK